MFQRIFHWRLILWHEIFITIIDAFCHCLLVSLCALAALCIFAYNFHLHSLLRCNWVCTGFFFCNSSAAIFSFFLSYTYFLHFSRREYKIVLPCAALCSFGSQKIIYNDAPFFLFQRFLFFFVHYYFHFWVRTQHTWMA